MADAVNVYTVAEGAAANQPANPVIQVQPQNANPVIQVQPQNANPVIQVQPQNAQQPQNVNPVIQVQQLQNVIVFQRRPMFNGGVELCRQTAQIHLQRWMSPGHKRLRCHRRWLSRVRNGIFG